MMIWIYVYSSEFHEIIKFIESHSNVLHCWTNKYLWDDLRRWIVSNTEPSGYQTLLLFHSDLIHIWYSLNPSSLIQLWNAWLRKNTTDQTTWGTWRGHGMPLPWQHMHFRSQSTKVSPSVHSAEILHYYNLTQPKSLKYECTSWTYQKHHISISYYNANIKYNCFNQEMLASFIHPNVNLSLNIRASRSYQNIYLILIFTYQNTYLMKKHLSTLFSSKWILNDI